MIPALKIFFNLTIVKKLTRKTSSSTTNIFFAAPAGFLLIAGCADVLYKIAVAPNAP